MNSVALSAGLIHLGMDTSKDKIAVGILRWDEASPDVEIIFNDEASIRRLINRFPVPGQLRVCYEAGPLGFELHRLLTSMGVACDVVAPSLIPTAPGDGSRPTGVTASGWPGCTGPVSWWRSGCRRRRRRRCGICAGPGPIWSMTAPVPGTG